MKHKRLSAVLGCVLALIMLAGLTVPLTSANSVTLEFLNPLGRIEPQENRSLAERYAWKLDENGKLTEKKVIMRLFYANSLAPTALMMRLIDEYGKYGEFYDDAGIILLTAGLSGNWGPKTEANYNVNWVEGRTGVTYVTAPAGAPADWNDKYSSGSGNYNSAHGPVDIAIMGVAD